MANKSSKSGKGAATKAAEAKVVEPTVQEEPVQEVAPQKATRPVVKEFSPNQIVTVRNGFQGKLVYRSQKTGERFVWDGFGAEQDMEISELRAARSSAKKYFINNWFMFDDPEVVDYLGMTQYYKFALNINEFDSLFEKSPAEIAETVAHLSDGQKKSVAYRAKQLITDGGIDSNRVIRALEESLGVELIER